MLSLALKCFKNRKTIFKNLTRKEEKEVLKHCEGFSCIRKILVPTNDIMPSSRGKTPSLCSKICFVLFFVFLKCVLKYSSLKVFLFLKCIWEIIGYLLLLDLCHCVSPWGTEKNKNRILIKLLSNSPSTVKNKINKDFT